MTWIVIVSIIALAWVAFRKDFEKFEARFLGGRMQREEARIADKGRGPFAHRTSMTVLEDVAAGRPLMGAQVTPEDMSADATYLRAETTPDSSDGARVYRTSWVARLLAPLVSAVLIAVILRFGMPGASGGSDVTGAMKVLAPLFGYSIILIWAFRAEIEGDTLRVMSAAFFMRSYRLSEIRRIHDDGPLYWRVVFADGRRPQVLKSVVGAEELRQRLADALKANERG